MKYVFAVITIIFIHHGVYCQTGKGIIFHVSNKEEYIRDELRIIIKNNTAKAIDFIVSIEVFGEGRWQEFYGDIFEFNRDVVKAITISSKKKKELRYPIYRIGASYQRLLSGREFRLVLHIFPRARYKNVYRVISNSFKMEWKIK